jgi:predicted  nucleic acid-binding Zn-ribbon protein
MPCVYDDPDPGKTERELRSELDRVTRLLCEAITNDDQILDYSLELSHWWQKHKRKDEQRKKVENEINKTKKAKADALAKLTEKEKKLLGL